MDSDDSNQTNKQAILRDLCNPIKPGSRILDLGCGNGKSVQKWRDLGYPAFGCDIKFKDENSPEVSSMLEENIIRLIQPNPIYCLLKITALILFLVTRSLNMSKTIQKQFRK